LIWQSGVAFDSKTGREFARVYRRADGVYEALITGEACTVFGRYISRDAAKRAMETEHRRRSAPWYLRWLLPVASTKPNDPAAATTTIHAIGPRRVAKS